MSRLLSYLIMPALDAGIFFVAMAVSSTAMMRIES
jgi:hypothetical protein